MNAFSSGQCHPGVGLSTSQLTHVPANLLLDARLLMTQCLANRRFQLFRIDGLEQVIQRCKLNGTQGILTVSRGENGLELVGIHILQQVKPRAVSHLDVQKQQLKSRICLDYFDAFQNGAGFRNHLYFRAMQPDFQFQRSPGCWFIVNNDGPDHGLFLI